VVLLGRHRSIRPPSPPGEFLVPLSSTLRRFTAQAFLAQAPMKSDDGSRWRSNGIALALNDAPLGIDGRRPLRRLRAGSTALRLEYSCTALDAVAAAAVKSESRARDEYICA